MKRLLLAVLLVVATFTPVSAADWRPQQPDRLASMDVEMAPLLTQYQPAFDAIVADFTVMSAFYQFTGVASALPDMQIRVDAAKRLPDDIAYALKLAHDALTVIQRYPPDACWASYWAALMTGWTAYGDAADQLSVGAMDDANRYIGLALGLLGAYGTLLHDVAVKDCS